MPGGLVLLGWVASTAGLGLILPCVLQAITEDVRVTNLRRAVEVMGLELAEVERSRNGLLAELSAQDDEIDHLKAALATAEQLAFGEGVGQ